MIAKVARRSERNIGFQPVGRTGILPVLFSASTGRMPIGHTARMAVLREVNP
jgi:hypothetical protein